MSKEIQLTQSYITIVDDEDFDFLNQWSWCSNVKSSGVYANRRCRIGSPSKQISIYMHRLVVKCPYGLYVDHINHNTLDNQKSNLRICSFVQNLRNNRKRIGTSSKFKGVTFHKASNKYIAFGNMSGKKVYLGLFESEIDAASAYNNYAIKNYKEFAKLNQL